MGAHRIVTDRSGDRGHRVGVEIVGVDEGQSHFDQTIARIRTEVDPVRLKQVLLNLPLSGAVIATGGSVVYSGAAMARLNDPDSADTQFFINVRDNHNLDFGIAGMGYAVFGEVVDGMNIVDSISTTPTTRRGEHEDTPQMPVVIVRAYEVDGPPAKDPAPATPETPAQP